MGKDYYKILGVTKTATDAEIKKAYKKLAMQWHPDKHDDSTRTKAEEMFKDIAEAYDVLSDAEKRKTYDQFGEEGVKNGGGAGGGGGHGFNSRDADFIFRQFFGGGGFGGDDDDGFPGGFSFGGMGGPFGGMGGMGGRGGMGGMGGMGGQRRQPPPPPKAEVAQMPLSVTLEELYTGKLKKLKVTRTRYKTKTESVREEKLVEINVRPGWKDGTKITFNGEGDQIAFGQEAGDLCFVVQTKEHARFKREDSNLVMEISVPLVKALTGCVVPVTTLDGRSLRINVEEVITPNFVKRVPGEGMPGKNGAKGDLLIKFNVVFPRTLSAEVKSQIATLLPSA